MKWESTDLTVGAVVLLAILILLGSLFFVTPWLREKTYPLYTEFDQIDGIGKGAPVQLRGYAVGKVSEIEPHVRDGSLFFRVRMDIQSHLATGDTLFLREGTRARLTPPPAPIGPGAIVLEEPEGRGTLIRPGETIPGVRTTAMLDQVQTLTADLGVELARTLQLSRVLMDSLTRTVATANQTVLWTSRQLGPLMEGVQAELVAAERLTTQLESRIGELTPSAVATIDSAQLLLGDSRRLVQDLNRMISTREPEITGIMASMDTTTVLLQNFLHQVSERPWKIFTGVKPPEGLYPPPPGPTVEETPETRTVQRP